MDGFMTLHASNRTVVFCYSHSCTNGYLNQFKPPRGWGFSPSRILIIFHHQDQSLSLKNSWMHRNKNMGTWFESRGV